MDLTNKPPVPDCNTFHQLSADHLDQSPSALVDSPTQASITLLRDKFFDEPIPRSSAAKIFAVIDRWNAAQPISKLPLELIAHIVTLGFPITAHYVDVGRPRHYMKALASLATISSMWRNTIIGTPSLWGLLSTHLPPHINRISLERSGTCPLMIVVVSWTNVPNLSKPDELLDIALPHRNRWMHVQLGFIPLARVMEYLTSAAPRLESFSLSVHLRGAAHLGPVDLFGGYAPSLQDVRVVGARIVLGSEVFRGLRKLSLDTIEGELISADQVVAILSASPGLELLEIEDVKVGFTRLPPSSTRTPIQLPHLKKIRLEDICIEAVGNILPFIRVPNCTSFQLLDVFQESDDPFDTTDFLSRSFGHFDSFIRSILAFHGSSQLSLYPELVQWLCKGPEYDEPPYFNFEVPSRMNISIPWISQFLGSELLMPTHELSVTFKLYQVDAENIAGLKTLALLPNVQTFQMDFTLPTTVGTILDLLGDASAHARGPAFPCLKTFRLDGACGRSLRDLGTMLMHRYGESGQSVTGPPSICIILAPPFGWQPADIRLQFEVLRRIRTTHGVESVTLISHFGPEGSPACICDDASGEYRNPV
ncbi:hypothetical protein FRC04_002446 [Tulasnella sp. 424]|nr:hypothetical protein FRC04_002446 [Tulasnella sp. 424]KAG8967391.1 hypothetical protein FRC05_002101 [Tulasnella sp. 425]